MNDLILFSLVFSAVILVAEVVWLIVLFWWTRGDAMKALRTFWYWWHVWPDEMGREAYWALKRRLRKP